jgi:hypothetical protein
VLQLHSAILIHVFSTFELQELLIDIGETRAMASSACEALSAEEEAALVRTLRQLPDAPLHAALQVLVLQSPSGVVRVGGEAGCGYPLAGLACMWSQSLPLSYVSCHGVARLWM